MKYKFNVTLTDQDYIDCNLFVLLCTPYGKKRMRNMRILIAVFTVLLLLFIGISATSVMDFLPTLFVGVLFQFIWRPLHNFAIKSTIRSMKKGGKLPYSPSSVIEFYDDVLVETTEDNKTEQKYTSLECISVVENKVIYFHIDNTRGYILPLSCFKSRDHYMEFAEFIKTKCHNFQVYNKG